MVIIPAKSYRRILSPGGSVAGAIMLTRPISPRQARASTGDLDLTCCIDGSLGASRGKFSQGLRQQIAGLLLFLVRSQPLSCDASEETRAAGLLLARLLFGSERVC